MCIRDRSYSPLTQPLMAWERRVWGGARDSPGTSAGGQIAPASEGSAMDSAGHEELVILVNVWIWDGIVIGTRIAPIMDTRLTMAKDIHLG